LTVAFLRLEARGVSLERRKAKSEPGQGSKACPASVEGFKVQAKINNA
jgi:hypothetical protein